MQQGHVAVRGRHRACGVTGDAVTQLRMRSLGPVVAAVVVAGVAEAGVVGRVVWVPDIKLGDKIFS